MAHQWKVTRLIASAAVGLAIAGSSVVVQGVDEQVSNSRGPTGYRGVVMADFEGIGFDDVVADLGTLGVWLYSDTWYQITTADPQWILAANFEPGSEVYLIGDFGPLGLWEWSFDAGPPGTWTKLSAADAVEGFATDDDQDGNEELQVNFGTQGLWRFDHDTEVWSRLTGATPTSTGLRTDLEVVGWQEGMWRFPGLGLWSTYWSGAPVWELLTGADATGRWASADFIDGGADPNDELAVEFTGIGTWVYDSDTGNWTRITVSQAAGMVPVRFGGAVNSQLLFADSGGKQLWSWGPTGTALPGAWALLSGSALDAGFVTPYNPDGLVEATSEQEVAADFGALGLWQYDNTTATWQRLSADNPVFMVKGDYFGDGVKDTLIVSFGPGLGLWMYDSGGGVLTPAWTKLTGAAPDQSIAW